MRVISFFFVLVFVVACNSDQKDANLKPRNLLEYGIPLTIMMPDSVVVTKENLVVQEEVTIKSQKPEDYYVRIYFGEATKSASEIKAQQLQFLKETDIFSKVVLDEPNGFIYEVAMDSTLFSYGFKRVLVQGGREYIFQSGEGVFTKEQIEKMYKATVAQQ